MSQEHLQTKLTRKQANEKTEGEISRKNKFKCAGENHTDKALLRAGLYSQQLRIVSKFFEKGNFVVQLNDASL